MAIMGLALNGVLHVLCGHCLPSAFAPASK